MEDADRPDYDGISVARERLTTVSAACVGEDGRKRALARLTVAVGPDGTQSLCGEPLSVHPKPLEDDISHAVIPEICVESYQVRKNWVKERALALAEACEMIPSDEAGAPLVGK